MDVSVIRSPMAAGKPESLFGSKVHGGAALLQPEDSPTERLIEFSFGNDSPPKRVAYRQTTKCEEILHELKVENPERTEIQLRVAGEDSMFKALAPGQFVGELIATYRDLEGVLNERFLVRGPEGQMYFPKGSSTDRIKKTLKGKNFTFFNLDYM